MKFPAPFGPRKPTISPSSILKLISSIALKLLYFLVNVPLYSELTVKEFIAYMADLKLVKRKEKKSEIERVLKQTGLTEVKSKLIPSSILKLISSIALKLLYFLVTFFSSINVFSSLYMFCGILLF